VKYYFFEFTVLETKLKFFDFSWQTPRYIPVPIMNGLSFCVVGEQTHLWSHA